MHRRGAGGPGTFGIWSLRWSADTREIIAGTGDYSVYVYDVERRKARSWDRLPIPATLCIGNAALLCKCQVLAGMLAPWR